MEKDLEMCPHAQCALRSPGGKLKVERNMLNRTSRFQTYRMERDAHKGRQSTKRIRSNKKIKSDKTG